MLSRGVRVSRSANRPPSEKSRSYSPAFSKRRKASILRQMARKALKHPQGEKHDT